MSATRRLALTATLLCAVAPALSAGAAEEGGRDAKRTVRVVEVPLRGAIAEQRAMEAPFGPQPRILRELTASIRKAAEDEKVHALLLRLGQPMLGLAKLQELTDAIAEFRAAKKKVYCYLDACGNGDYLIASSSDRICAPPGGMVMLTGLGAQATFLKGLLDWAGIEADMLQFGKHKGAADPLTRDSMSEENRRVLNELLDDLYGQFVDAIAKGRHLSAKKVREAIDDGPYPAREARIFQLIDDVAYYDQFLDSIGQDLDGKVEIVKDYYHLGRQGPDLSEFNLFTFFAALKPKPDIPATPRPKVVILMASGMILWSRSAYSFSEAITATEMHELFEKVRKDDTVKAVVLRVDSPGGSALVSDLIWREVERTKKAGKPVIASMSDVAGSGGYYIAMGCDKIVAQPATITGSIGVVGGKLVLRGLYGKLGITRETFTRGKNAALFSDYTPFSEHERERVKALMQDIYNDFVHKAALGRGMDPEKMLELATGRVWSARTAKELGLVDVLGGLKEAYELAVEKAGLKDSKDVQPVILPREKSVLEALFAPAVGASAARSAFPVPGPVLRTLPTVEVLEALAQENVLALMPYFIEVR